MTAGSSIEFVGYWMPQTRFFISIAQGNIEGDNTMMSKVAKGKGKTHSKNGKTTKCAEYLVSRLVLA